MKYIIASYGEVTYVYFNDSETKLASERNIIDIITVVAENNTQYILFDSQTLSNDFFQLKKGLLGVLLQKFTMYNIKMAILIKDNNSLTSEFRDAIAESRKHDVLGLFTDIGDAEEWFLSLK